MEKVIIIASFTFLFIIVAIAYVAGLAPRQSRSVGTGTPLAAKTVTVNGKTLRVQVADTSSSRVKGLSGKESISDDEGILFVFDEAGMYPFWMKDMKFPVDIIWIKKNKEIAGVIRDVRPESYPSTFTPPEPVRYVIEVNAGWANANNIKLGDTIDLP